MYIIHKLWKTNVFVCLLLMILPWVLYHQSISFGYVLDDAVVITGNSFTKEGIRGLKSIFTTESFTGYFGEQKDLVQGARYRPLSIATFALEYQFIGEYPSISHAINILLYGILGVTLFFLLRLIQYTENQRFFWNLGFLTSILYIVHPLHTEAVANIKGRDEILTFLLGALSLIACIQWHNSKKNVYAYLSGFSFLLALLAKENAITLLGVIPVIFYVFKNVSLLRSLLYAIPAIAATVVYLIIRIQIIGYLLNDSTIITDIMNNPFIYMSQSEKYATITYTLLKYLQLSVFPHPLSHDYYPFAIPVMNWSNISVWFSLFFHIVLCLLTLMGILRKQSMYFGLAFYLITLSIVSNLFINMGTFMNERFLFMPSFGICIMMSFFLLKVKEWTSGIPNLKYSATLLFIVIVTGYIYKTLDRVPDWENPVTLNQSAVKTNPGSARANTFMATAIYDKWKNQPRSEEKYNDIIIALEYAERATQILPEYKNAQIIKAGCAAELYNYDRNLNQLLKVFGEVVLERPDVGFVKEYMDYLLRTTPIVSLIPWYKEIVYQGLVVEKKLYPYGVVFLNAAYIQDRNQKIIRDMLAYTYQKAGNKAKADELLQQ